jgi:DNA-binding NarL/FixJ family response regulator
VQEPRVLIVDEHRKVRQALEARLRSSEGIRVVGCTGDWQDGVSMAVDFHADVILLETKRSDGRGMSALRRLRTECPGACVIVLTSYTDSEEQEEALRAGAVRYLLKDIGSEYLVQQILDVARPQAAI